MELSELKQKAEAIRSQRQHSHRGHWPESFKEAVAEYCRNGGETSEVIKTTGLPRQTIRSWIDTKTHSLNQVSSFKTLAVQGISSSQSISVSWQNTMEIKGLSFEQLRLLLQEGLL